MGGIGQCCNYSWGAIDATRLSFAGIMQAKIFDLNIIFESSNYLWNLSPIYETFHRRAASFASQINIMISLFWPPVSKPPHPALSLKKLLMIALADAPGRQVTPINLSLKLHNHPGSIRYVHWFSLHQFFSAPSPDFCSWICLSYFIFSYMFPFHLFSQLWFGLAVHLRHFWVPILWIRPAGLVRKIEESCVPGRTTLRSFWGKDTVDR